MRNVYLFLKVVDDRLYGGTFIVLLDIRLQQVVCNLFSLQKETFMQHMDEINHTRTYSRLYNYRAMLPTRIRTPHTTVLNRALQKLLHCSLVQTAAVLQEILIAPRRLLHV